MSFSLMLANFAGFGSAAALALLEASLGLCSLSSLQEKENIEKLEQELSNRVDDIGVLKARLVLDLVDISVNVVAEYPDMVEENNMLFANNEILMGQIKEYERREVDLKNDNYQLTEQCRERDEKIKLLDKQKDQLNKKLKDATQQISSL